MNKRQHKKNFINKVYGLSLNNDYVVVEFDTRKTKPTQCFRIMESLSKKVDKNKLLGIADGMSVKTMNLDELVKMRDFLDKRIEELEK